MIIDGHTHRSTRQQWGRIFVEVVESGRGGHGTLDQHRTPERYWTAMDEASPPMPTRIRRRSSGSCPPSGTIRTRWVSSIDVCKAWD